METGADIDAIIVAYNSGAELQVAVTLLLSSPRLASLSVVDNASVDGCTDFLAGRDDARVRLLRQSKNLGFGAAINLAAAALARPAPWLLLVNPDLELPAAQLDALRNWAGSEIDLGAASAQLVFADGRPEPAALRRDPTPARVLRQLTGLARLFAGRSWAEGIAITPQPGRQTVDACSGALMLLPRSAFDQVGGFDPGYFLHCEDLDLCRRLRQAGRRIVVDADLMVLHHKGTSSGNRLAVLRHKQAGMLRYFRKFDAAGLPEWRRWLVECCAALLFAAQRAMSRIRRR